MFCICWLHCKWKTFCTHFKFILKQNVHCHRIVPTMVREKVKYILFQFFFSYIFLLCIILIKLKKWDLQTKGNSSTTKFENNFLCLETMSTHIFYAIIFFLLSLCYNKQNFSLIFRAILKQLPMKFKRLKKKTRKLYMQLLYKFTSLDLAV